MYRISRLGIYKIFATVFCLFVFCQSVSAIAITEIHFDPAGSDTDREWIEVLNDTVSAVDFSEIKFFENNVNHSVDIFNKPNSTEKIVQPGEYVVIVQDLEKFKIDFPDYAGKIFKASFSLSNTGETLALKSKDGDILFSISYTENSKQDTPSPGLPNTILNTNSSSTQSTTTSTTTSSVTNTESPNFFYRSYWPDSEKIYVKAGENKVVMLGQEIIFQPKVLDGNKKEIKNGLQYRWSFGDGYTSSLAEGKHAFRFEGDFVANLQVNYNGYTEEDRVYLKVVEPRLNINISPKVINVGTSSQKVTVDVIEIFNDNEVELDLGNLQISNENNKVFLLPEKLIVLRRKKIFLAPDLTGFSSSTNKVVLSLLSGKVISQYEKSVATSTVFNATSSNPVMTSAVVSTSSESVNKSTYSVLRRLPSVKKQVTNINTSEITSKSYKTEKLQFDNSYQPTETLFAKFVKILGL